MVMSEQEWRAELRVAGIKLNTTFGNNGRNLKEISKHQELSCGTGNPDICEIINFPRCFIVLRQGASQITQQS